MGINKTEIQVEVPRAILFLSRNAYLPLHFPVLRHAARAWGACEDNDFATPAVDDTNPKNFGSSASKTSSAWFGLSSRMNSVNGIGAAVRSSFANFDDEPPLPPGPPDFEKSSSNSSVNSDNPFDAVDFHHIPSFEPSPSPSMGRRRSSAVSSAGPPSPTLTKSDSSYRGRPNRRSLLNADATLFQFLDRYQSMHIPHPTTPLPTGQSSTVKFNLFPHHQPDPASVIKFNPRKSAVSPLDANPFILEWALPTLLKFLSLDNVLLILGCALTEMQVVFSCSDISSLSCCVVAITSLLRPLKWACPVIVTLPTHLHIYLESPVPVILGVTSLPPGHEPPTGQVVIDIDRNKVDMNQEDMMAYHTLIIPKISNLNHDLLPHVERLESELGTRSSTPFDSAQADDHYAVSPTVTTREVSPILTTSSITPTNQLLLSMKRFVALTQAHVEMLVSSAIKLEHEREQQKERASNGAKEDALAAEKKKEIDASGKDPLPEPLEKGRAVSMTDFNERQWWEQRLGGESGIAFMDRMMETQMYNGYVFELKRQENKKNRKARNRRSTCGSNASDDFGEFLDFAESRPGDGKNLRSRGSTTFADNFHSRNSAGPDSLLAPAFSSSDDKQNFERRYSARALRKKSAAMGVGLGFEGGKAGDTIDVARELASKNIIVDLMECIISGAPSENSEKKEESDEKESTEPMWCNGRCAGAVNTEYCTMLCVQVWENGYLQNVLNPVSPLNASANNSGPRLRGASFLIATDPKRQPPTLQETMKKGVTRLPKAVIKHQQVAHKKIKSLPGPGTDQPNVLKSKPLLTVDTTVGPPSKKSNSISPSVTANVVQLLLKKRKHASKKKHARQTIVKFLAPRVMARVKARRFDVGIIKLQALARRIVARKAFGRVRNQSICDSVDRHLRERLDSTMKAERDIDWLFRQSTIDSEDLRRSHQHEDDDNSSSSEENYLQPLDFNKEEIIEHEIEWNREWDSISASVPAPVPAPKPASALIAETIVKENMPETVVEEKAYANSVQHLAYVKSIEHTKEKRGSVTFEENTREEKPRTTTAGVLDEMRKGWDDSFIEGAFGDVKATEDSDTGAEEVAVGFFEAAAAGVGPAASKAVADDASFEWEESSTDFAFTVSDETFDQFGRSNHDERMSELTDDGGFGKIHSKLEGFDSDWGCEPHSSPPSGALFSVAEVNARGGEEEEDASLPESPRDNFKSQAADMSEAATEVKLEDEKPPSRPEVQLAEESKGWSCPRCTLINEAVSTVCEACEYKKEVAEAGEVEQDHATFAQEDTGEGNEVFGLTTERDDDSKNEMPPPPPRRKGPNREMFNSATRDRQATKVTTELAESVSLSDEEFLRRFKERLEKGFVVKKHGRRGLPQRRVIYCDEEQTMLLWRPPTKQELEDTGNADAGLEAMTRLSLSDESAATVMTTSTGTEQDTDRDDASEDPSSREKKRSMSMVQSVRAGVLSLRGQRKIMFEDVEEVSTAGSTEIMKTSLRSGQVGGGNTQYGHMLISLVMHKGKTVGQKAYSRKDTLDLEVSSPVLYKLLTKGLAMCVVEANLLADGRGRVLSKSARRSSVGRESVGNNL